MHIIPLSRYQKPHLIQILELLSFLGLSFVLFLFSCEFDWRLPKLLSLKQTENGVKANKPRDTLRFSQENSKNCHVPATCPLHSFFWLNSFRWLRKLYSKFIELYVWLCVSRSHPHVLSHCYWEWRSYIKENTLFIISLSFHVCLKCQGCQGRARRSCRLLWVWAGTGLCGLERFYQEKEDATPVPNTKGKTKQKLETQSKWLYSQLKFHASVIRLVLRISYCFLIAMKIIKKILKREGKKTQFFRKDAFKSNCVLLKFQNWL